MTDYEQEEFERQLRQSKPAKLPENFNVRLLAAEPQLNIDAECVSLISPVPDFLRALQRSIRWLIPATAVALVVILIWYEPFPSGSLLTVHAAPVLNADDVKIDQRLVSSFDAIVRLPGGEPVRFRCENWMDQVILSDKSGGLVVENNKPRIEVLATGFETY